MAKLLIRKYQPDDRSLLLDTYVRTYRASQHARYASPDLLAEMMDGMLSPTSGWTTSVAVDPESPDVIFGWITWRPTESATQPLVAWLQVRRQWRRRGIGKALTEHAGVSKGELEVGGMVRRVDGPGSPFLVDLAEKAGVTLRYRPFLPLLAASQP